MVTHTPITHWIPLTWGEICAWSATVVDIQQADEKAGKN